MENFNGARWRGEWEPKTYTEADMVEAYVAGAKRMFLGERKDDSEWTVSYQVTAEALARIYLEAYNKKQPI